MSIPQFVNHSPPNGFIGTSINTPVFFRVIDAAGLNVSTLHVIVDGVDAILGGVFQSGFVGAITNENPTPTAISLIINKVVGYPYSHIVNVASKIFNNSAIVGNDTISFVTLQNPDHTAPIVAASPHGALFNTAQSVTLASNELNVTIRYTLDGQEPTLGSPVYSAPINILTEGKTTLKFIGIDLGGNSDKIRTEVYEIDTIAPVTTAIPAGGDYFNSQNVELVCDDPKATIYYTTNGTNPTIHSQIYSTPIATADNVTTVVKFFAVDKAGNVESIKTETYVIEIAKNNYVVRNVNVRHAYVRNELEIVWEDMHPLFTNIIGYNIYRSDTEIGEYNKLNKDLITVTQYVDRTLDTEIVKEDASEQFRRTVNISREINDNFNGEFYDVTKWKEADVAELLFQFNGLIFTDKVGLKQESKLTSKFKLKGNFDIQLDFELLKWVVPLGAIQSCIFRVKRDDNNFIQIAREMSQSANVYNSNRYVNGNPDLPISVSSIDDYGTFKMTRVGNIITTYFLADVEIQITNEVLISSGDPRHFNLAHFPIVLNSCTVYKNGNPLTIDTDYTINEKDGTILLTADPLLADTFSATYKYSEKQFSSIQSFNAYTDDLYVELVGRSADVPVEVRMSKFQMNSGNPIIIQPLNQLLEYVIQTMKQPIVDSSGANKPTDDITEVEVTINDQKAAIKKVFGIEGVIQLETERAYDEVLKKWYVPPKPDEYSTVLVTYKTPKHTTIIDLRKNYFYKVTSVTHEDETDLYVIQPEYVKPEKLTYIFEEAIRRNAWLLDRCERVLLYLKKRAGEVCPCTKKGMVNRTHKQPQQDCLICYGTGFVGGYSIVYPIKVANLTAEQKIQQTERGLHLGYQIETWTGPFPIITQRDFFVRRNGDRCLIGPVTPVEGEGGILTQQHFTIEVLDARDIRYTFPIQPLQNQYQIPFEDKTATKVPEVDSPKEREELITSMDKTEPGNKNVDQIVRGRNLTFENENF